jgi:hypothetical protein
MAGGTADPEAFFRYSAEIRADIEFQTCSSLSGCVNSLCLQGMLCSNISADTYGTHLAVAAACAFSPLPSVATTSMISPSNSPNS